MPGLVTHGRGDTARSNAEARAHLNIRKCVVPSQEGLRTLSSEARLFQPIQRNPEAGSFIFVALPNLWNE